MSSLGIFDYSFLKLSSKVGKALCSANSILYLRLTKAKNVSPFSSYRIKCDAHICCLSNDRNQKYVNLLSMSHRLQRSRARSFQLWESHSLDREALCSYQGTLLTLSWRAYRLGTIAVTPLFSLLILHIFLLLAHISLFIPTSKVSMIETMILIKKSHLHYRN